jgi:hypothetical protein
VALLERDVVVEALERLITRTVDKRQDWEVFDGADDGFVTNSGKFSYSIESRDGDGNAPYTFEIYRLIPATDDKEADAVRVGELSTTSSPSASSPAAVRNRMLSRIYAEAKTSALGISGLKDDLLDELS